MKIKYSVFDGRSKQRRWLKKNGKTLLGVTVLGMFAGAIFSLYLFNRNNTEIISPVGKPEVKIEVKQVEATEIPFCYDPITCIRDVGEEMGFSNTDITVMVKVAKCESGYKPGAKNPDSTATGIFQIIIGTWDSNKCEGERWDYQDNIKCAWKIYKLRGTQPWNASKHCWSK